jgi:hypothetical protein
MGKITDEAVENFRRMMKDDHGVDLDFVEAKVRYLQLLNLFWILAHRAPKEGDPPYEPPPPPWL